MRTALMTLIRRASVAATLVFTVAGCKDVLNVSNPGALKEEQLTNPALEQFLVNGAIGEFQYAYGYYALWSAMLSDEAYTDHTEVGIRELSLHTISEINSTNEAVFGNLQRGVASGDDAVTRLKVILGAGASSSISVARALAYGGYSYVLLGEGFCEAPVALGPGLTSAQLQARAVQHFDSAVTIAQAYAAIAGQSAANVAVATDLINMARVGAARASLKSGDLAKARTYAALVPDTYEKFSYYSANSVRENNIMNSGIRLTGAWQSMAAPFLSLNDPRVPQSPTTKTGLQQGILWLPLRPSQYSGWVATGTPGTIDITSNVRFAGGLEARYIGIEADGPNAAMLTFVNARRAVGGKAPVTLAGAELLAEFRMQRGIDFYLTGQRLGDMRRYKAAGTDLFPKGKYPVNAEVYGTATCFVVPLSEKTGNPNYR